MINITNSILGIIVFVLVFVGIVFLRTDIMKGLYPFKKKKEKENDGDATGGIKSKWKSLRFRRSIYKLLGFVGVMILFRIVTPYWSERLINAHPLVIWMYGLSGALFALLSRTRAWENDVGRKTLASMVVILVCLVPVNFISIEAWDFNFLRWNWKRSVAVVQSVQTPARAVSALDIQDKPVSIPQPVIGQITRWQQVTASDFVPVSLPGKSSWQALTATENGKMVQEVKSGQTVYVLNEQKAEFLVGVEGYSKGIFDIAKLKIPISQTGQLYFNNIPDNATLWYCVG